MREEKRNGNDDGAEADNDVSGEGDRDHRRVSAFQQADYQVVDGPSNQVQWLGPDDVTTVGSPIPDVAANMANPPAASVYSIASINRTLGSSTLYMTLR